MAKYTFYPQIKTSYLYTKTIMYIAMVISFVYGWVAVAFYQQSNFLFLPFFMLILYDIFLYKPMLKYWDMGGFKKMVIDTNAKVVIFDDRVRLNLDKVERVRIEMEERPTMFWFPCLFSQYVRLVNAELMFKLETKTNTVIYLQFKKDVKKICSIMRDMGKPCRIIHEELLEEGIPNYIWYLLGLFGIVGGFGYCVFVFFQKLIHGSGF